MSAYLSENAADLQYRVRRRSSFSAIKNADLIAKLIAKPFQEPAYLYCSFAVSIPVRHPLQNCAEPLAECVRAGVKQRWRLMSVSAANSAASASNSAGAPSERS